MKIQFIILSLAFLISTTGCEQKSSVTSTPSIPEPEKTLEVQETITPTKPVEQETIKPVKPVVQEKQAPIEAVKTTQTKPVAAEKSDVVSTPKMPQTSEQSLAEVASYGRDVTKTHTSKTRTRAQLAEDEMMKDVAAHK